MTGAMAQAGDVFSDRYEIVRAVARGGTADVYLARDRLLDRDVAVKVLFPEFARDPSFVARFRREAQSAAALSHPNIVTVYDWGEEHGTYFIVMEYVEGRSLRDVIRQEGPLAPITAARIAAAIADALAYAHRSGLVHRDVKPGNVILTEDGQVKVADFGIAASETSPGEGLTKTGLVMGTATYFSPEQAQGFPVDARTDVYALGVVLFEMATGQPPFTGDTPVAVAMQHVRDQPPRPSTRMAGIPADFERIVLHALAKDAGARYQSVDELRADLVRFGRGRPVAAQAPPMRAQVVVGAPPTTPGTRPVPARAPRPRRLAPVIAVFVGLVVLGGAAAWALLSTDLGGGGSTQKLEVPNVVEVPDPSFDAAKAVLEARGFKVAVVQDPTRPETPGRVVAQDPPGGRLLAKGGTVTLTISATDAVIPNVDGKTFADAQSAISRLGLTVNRVDQLAPGTAKDTVLRTDPAGGTTVARGSTVTVYAAGDPQVPVPDVMGKTREEAQVALALFGLNVTFVDSPSDVIDKDHVISTNPAPGVTVNRGSTVTVTVSSGPAEVDIPNVVGLTRNQGESALIAAGFNVTVTFAPSPGNVGKVISQSQTGKAPPRTNITIVVGQ